MSLMGYFIAFFGYVTALGFTYTFSCANAEDPDRRRVSAPKCRLYAGVGLTSLIVGIVGLFWCFASPPPFAIRATEAPRWHLNDPASSVYFGDGCFWHTQYDTWLVEQDRNGSFGGRGHSEVTSLIGYAGGLYAAPDGTVCYHGVPASDYGLLGHAEAVSVELSGDAGRKQAQVAELAHHFFEDGFASVRCETGDLGCVNGFRRQRLDPQDFGPMYRNNIGLPGGMANEEWFPLIQAANTYQMPLIEGAGGAEADREGEYVVYIYDSDVFPFFRGEGYHQFHPNDVLGRPVPLSYLTDLKEVQRSLGRLDGHGCIDPPQYMLGLLWPFIVGLPLGCANTLLILVYRWFSQQGDVPGGRVAADIPLPAKSQPGNADVVQAA